MNLDTNPLVNRVASSGIEVINLEDFYPTDELATFDIKDYLFMELILKEKDFRTALKELDWTQFDNKILLVHCSADAIIPMWAYMLVGAYANEHAKETHQCQPEEYIKLHYQKVLSTIDPTIYAEKRVVIKGCGDKDVPPFAYLKIVQLLKPHAQSIMYGEPCSTVPIFKRPRKITKR